MESFPQKLHQPPKLMSGWISQVRFAGGHHSRRRGSAALPAARAVDSLFAAAGGAGFLDGLFDRFTGFARALLNPAYQFFLLAFDELQIAIRELGPFLFQLALGDVPVAFDFECGHNSYFCCLF
jgi:hypothetical protein